MQVRLSREIGMVPGPFGPRAYVAISLVLKDRHHGVGMITCPLGMDASFLDATTD